MPPSIPPRSDPEPAIARLRRAIEAGDWPLARSVAQQLAGDPMPEDAEALARRLRQLGELLSAARASRAQLADSLARVRAAVRFGDASAALFPRQNLVEPLDI